MEDVDWDMADTDGPAEHIPFGENQVGSVTQALEPVHVGSPVSWVAGQFAANPGVEALPVETDSGVVGVVVRSRILERASRFLDGLTSRSLDQDLSPHQILDARESVDKVVAEIFAGGVEPLVDHFLVFLNGRYYGVTDLRKLVSRSALLRNLDLGKAREVQEGAMAKSRLPATAWTRAKLVRMAYGVGGDFYQELSWADGTCVLGCFDVSGKGVAGSLVTSALAGYFAALRTDSTPAPDLGAFTLRLNTFLREILPLGTFVTGVLFSLPARADQYPPVKILNFGYGPVFIFQRKDGKVLGRSLAPRLPPLGLETLESPAAQAVTVPLEPGTKIFTFSDGLTDLVDQSGERYGEARLRSFLTKCYKMSTEAFLSSLESEIRLWQGKEPQADDITALTIQP